MHIPRVAHHRSHRFVHDAGTFLFLSMLFSPLFSVPAGAAADRQVPPGLLDLPAMVLTPDDLQSAGFDDYGLGYSEMMFEDAFVASTAVSREMSENDVRSFLQDTGFERAYYAYLYPPAANDGAPAEMVATYVVQFSNADSATAAWDFLEDESSKVDTKDLPALSDYGDQSEGTLEHTADPTSGDPITQLDTTIQLGNLHVGVSIVHFSDENPATRDAESLAERLLDRVDRGIQSDDSGLSNQVVRLSGDEVSPNTDAYLLRDGEITRLYGETTDPAELADALDQIDETGEYRLWQQVASWGDQVENSVWSYISLLHFADDRAASDWLAQRPDQINADERYTNIDFGDEPDIGDGAITYTSEANDGRAFFRGLTFQFSDLVVTIDISGPAVPPADAIETLVDAQLTCLEDGACPNPLEVPVALQDYVAEASNDDAPQNQTRPESTPEAVETPVMGSEGIYEGVLYNFTLTYDASIWELTPEDDPKDDAYEWIVLTDPVSTVWMVGDPDFTSDQLGDCVTYYLIDQGFDNGAWEAEPIDDLVVTDDRAFASYSLAQPLFALTAYLYLECRSIGDGQTLVIIHFVSTEKDDPATTVEIEAVNQLLEGIST